MGRVIGLTFPPEAPSEKAPKRGRGPKPMEDDPPQKDGEGAKVKDTARKD